MVHNDTGPVKGIPKNLLSYKEIPWNDLDPLAAAMLAAGAKNCSAEHLFFIAARLARIAKQKRLITKILDLWLADNKDLDQYLVSAMNSAFVLVYKGTKNDTGRDTGHGRPKWVTDNQFKVLEALKYCEKEYEEPFAVSFPRLMSLTGLSKTTLLRIVKFLENKNLIKICQPGGSNPGEPRHSTVYQISSTTEGWL